MNFNDAVNWLYSFQKFGIKLGLERIRFLVKELQNPQEDYKIIHVGGTNGKGSVCNFLNSILTEGGYKVGIYTSPHLQHISERIAIGNKAITEEEFISLINSIKPIVNKMKMKKNSPTFFEIITAMAFKYFSIKKVDYAIIEVGLGGKYDATNIVDPIITIITNISLDHQNTLGKKISDITYEKAGIIKKNIPLITACKENSLKILKKEAEEKNASIINVNKKNWRRINFNKNGQKFYVKGLLKDYIIETELYGIHQGENISLTINAIENLQLKGVYITDENIFFGIQKTKNNGRLEFISHNPDIILDGAHNPAGITTLYNTLKNDFQYDKIVIILGILSDKNINQMLKKIIKISDIIITTKPNILRACHPTILKNIIKKIDIKTKVIVKENIVDSIKYAEKISNKNDLICITGSLYSIGEARDFFFKDI